jgi:hypothetical protein
VILFSLALLAFAVTDLVRWHPDQVSLPRSAVAVAAGVGAAVGVAALSATHPCSPLLTGAVALPVLLLWTSLDYEEIRPIWGLVLVLGVLLTLFGLSGSADPISGPLEEWYDNLGFSFVRDVSVDEFVLGASASLFLLATTNRVVRLVLDAAIPDWERGEDALKGGRLLGPLERLIVGSIVLAGDPAAAAIVIAAKGLLRFPEIRQNDDGPGPEAVTEYFLIGTLTSLLIAALAAILVAGAG